MAKCSKCSDTGVIEIGERMVECECALIRRIAMSMPAYIRRAEVRAEHVALPAMSMVRRNILVVASWQDMKALVKAVMIANQRIFVKVTSDREIRDVYVGSKSRAAKGDEDGQVFNSLEDLMDPPGLVIVRLNELAYKNKAASGALQEAICYRIDREKPTWLFSDIDKPFSLGSHAYSDSIADVVKTSFPVCRVDRILPAPSMDFEQITGAEDVARRAPLRAPSQEDRPAQPDAPPARVEKTVMAKPLNTASPRPAKRPEPAVEMEPELVEAEPEKPKPRIRPSEDDDASPGGLSMYGAGLTKKGPSKGFGRGGR